MRRRSDLLRAVMSASGADLMARARLLTGDDAAAAALLERALADGLGRGHRPDSVEQATAEVRRVLHRRFSASRDAEPALAARDAAEANPAAEPDIREALRLLSRRERAAAVLRFADGKAVPTIAAELGASTRSVRADLESAVARLGAARPDLRLDLEDALEGGVDEELTVTFGARS